MRASFLMLLLAAYAGAALADWQKLAEDESGNVYADRASLRKAGNKVKLSAMVEHKAALADSFGKSHISETMIWEYDCKEQQKRMLSYVTFSEPGAKGKAVYSDAEPGKWLPMQGGPGGAALGKLACGKP